jgi:hypothetical protein
MMQHSVQHGLTAWRPAGQAACPLVSSWTGSMPNGVLHAKRHSDSTRQHMVEVPSLTGDSTSVACIHTLTSTDFEGLYWFLFSHAHPHQGTRYRGQTSVVPARVSSQRCFVVHASASMAQQARLSLHVSACLACKALICQPYPRLGGVVVSTS